MSDISYYTEEGYQSLKDEVHHLKAIERPKISSQIGEAIDKGDLSENAELMIVKLTILRCLY
jgi:transcription elongation factor GreA